MIFYKKSCSEPWFFEKIVFWEVENSKIRSQNRFSWVPDHEILKIHPKSAQNGRFAYTGTAQNGTFARIGKIEGQNPEFGVENPKIGVETPKFHVLEHKIS